MTEDLERISSDTHEAVTRLMSEQTLAAGTDKGMFAVISGVIAALVQFLHEAGSGDSPNHEQIKGTIIAGVDGFIAQNSEYFNTRHAGLRR